MERSEKPLNMNHSTPIIKVEGLCKQFGTLFAVRDISFTVQRGSIIGFVGSDGAGKTTLLRMIATMILPSSGRILLDSLDGIKKRKKVKDIIGYMPQKFGLYQDLTVGENLDFFMDIFGIFGPERIRRRDHYLDFSGLQQFVDRPAGVLSGGMKQKLGLACVLIHEPKILILDEPTNGVDPISRGEFWDILIRMKAEGMAILISTAYLDEGAKCDRLILMHRSHVLEEATPGHIRAHFASLEEAMMARIQEVDKELANERFNP